MKKENWENKFKEQAQGHSVPPPPKYGTMSNQHWKEKRSASAFLFGFLA